VDCLLEVFDANGETRLRCTFGRVVCGEGRLDGCVDVDGDGRIDCCGVVVEDDRTEGCDVVGSDDWTECSVELSFPAILTWNASLPEAVSE